MSQIKVFSFLMMFVFMFSFTSALTCHDTVQVDTAIELIQKCPTCTYVNITTIDYPNGTVFINDAMSAKSNGVDYNYTLPDASQVGTITYTTIGDKDGREQIEDLCIEITRTGGVTPEGVPILQGFLIFLVFATAGFMLYMSEKFQESGPKIFFMLLGFVFLAGSLLTAYQVLMAYNASVGLSLTLNALIFVVLTVLLIVFLLVMIRQTIIVLDFLKISRGLKWGGGPSMKGHSRTSRGF